MQNEFGMILKNKTHDFDNLFKSMKSRDDPFFGDSTN